MWVESLLVTLSLIGSVSLIAIPLGAFLAVTAWLGNHRFAYVFPLFSLAVPPWYLGYLISEFVSLRPFWAATLALGISSSIYPFVVFSAALANTSHLVYESMLVFRGKTWYSLFQSLYPLKKSIIPALALVGAETLSDFGVSNFYGIPTLTMSSYNTWMATWQVSSIIPLLGTLFFLGFLLSRFTTELFPVTADASDKKSWTFSLLSLVPTLAILIFSLFVSLKWTLSLDADIFQSSFSSTILRSLENTLYLLALTVLVCGGIVVFYLKSRRLSSLGIFTYSLPGILIGFAFLPLARVLPYLAVLSLAIAFRYFGLILNALESSLRVGTKYLELGVVFDREKEVKFALMKRSLLVSSGLLILDVLRELPISTILQPMNFHTIAMRMAYVSKTESLVMLGPYGLVLLGFSLLVCLGVIRASTLLFDQK